jgi:hypothetical protein
MGYISTNAAFLALILTAAAHGKTVGGVMDLEVKSKDFGTITQGEHPSYEFKFRNTGDAPLRLKGAYGACGCTVAEFAKDSIYAPGQEGVITVKFDSARFSGQVSKAITVMTDEQGIAERLLTVKANVVEEFQVTPPVADFGAVNDAKSGGIDLSVTPVNGFPLEVQSLEFDSTVLTATLEKISGRWKIHLELNQNQPAGFLRQELQIVTNSKKLPKFAVPVRANIKGDIAFGPEYLEFGSIDRDASVKREIKVDLKGKYHIVKANSLLHINGNQVQDHSHFLTVALPSQDGARPSVDVTLTNHADFAGSVHGSVQLETDDPREKVIRVDFYSYFR